MGHRESGSRERVGAEYGGANRAERRVKEQSRADESERAQREEAPLLPRAGYGECGVRDWQMQCRWTSGMNAPGDWWSV